MWKITHQLPNNYRKKKLFIKKLHTQRTFLFFQNVSDVLKTCLQDVSQDFFKMSSRSLQDVYQNVFKMTSRCVCKMSSSIRLQGIFKRTSRRRLEDILKDKKMSFWKHLQNVFKTPSPRWMFAWLQEKKLYWNKQ